MTSSVDQVKQWGPVATAYVGSSYHASGPDLKRIVEVAGLNGTQRVLDLGSGPGHTTLACAPHATEVIGVDVTPQMVQVATDFAAQRGVTNVSFRVADSQSLPFDDASFDVVTSRVSAHHYADAATAVREAYRVLKPGGTFVVADSISPDNAALDTFLNCIEILRDASHVRDYSWDEWQNFLEGAGFVADFVELFSVYLDGEEWVKRIQTPPAKVEILRTLFAEANDATKAAFVIQEQPSSWTIPIGLMKGRKRL